MVNKALLWATTRPGLQRQMTENTLARRVSHRFVAGERLDEALDVATKLNSEGIGAILDLLGEGVTDLAGAAHAVERYEEATDAIAARELDAAISIKLSQLGQTVDRDGCVANLNEILDHAQSAGVRVEIDMEESGLVSDTLSLFQEALTKHPETRLAIQAALRRTPLDLEAMASLKPRIRLVKGAYAEPFELAHHGKKEIQAQYKYLTDWLFENGTDPAFGTHDSELIEYAQDLAGRAGRSRKDFEIQLLYGIRRDLQHKLTDAGYRVRVYIPFGSAWYPYLTRRMAERPSNLLFFMRAVVGR
jgi:proline dehydrogenase